MMQYKKGARAIGRVGACLAFASSVLVFAGPASASAAVPTAQEYGYGYGYGHEQFSVYLTGDEVRNGGDPEGRGFARLDFDPENNRVCYAVTWRRLEGAVTAFQLHIGSRFDRGPVLINFFNRERYDGDGGAVTDCVYGDLSRIRDVREDPANYYLALRTTASVDDAIRGQLD
ncbi:MAG: CHRD domain-containing protein [Pseudonocardiaceae bacterium]